MPLTPPGIVGVLAPSLLATGMLGTGMPQLATGVANGVCLWTKVLQVSTIDVGTLGAGVGLLPCAIPPPLLLAGIQGSFLSMGILGVMSPLLAGGLSTGLSTAFLQGAITTTHPSVGVGTATATFPGPSCVPFMISGFASAGMVGPGAVRMATAIGLGLDTGFAGFVVPVPIVGSPSPSGSSGVGTGKIV